MPITLGVNVPWLENWPIQRQLWAAPHNRIPGNELDLSVAAGRNLRVAVKAGSATVWEAMEPHPQLQILQPPQRGVVQFRLKGNDWNQIRRDVRHEVEIYAYGYLYDSFALDTDLPEPRVENLNGITLYASPREVLEVLGPIVGPDTAVSVPLMEGWTLSPQGYWQRDIPAEQALHGLWVNDYHVHGPVPYEALALAPTRAFARVAQGATTHRLYVKLGQGDRLDDPTRPAYVETAHNIYVWRCLAEASAQCERRAQRSFGLNRIYREAYDGRHRQRQIVTRQAPVYIDEFFRLDAYAFTRNLFRRYTEEDFLPQNALFVGGRVLHCQENTGIITVNQNFWDWWDAGTIIAGDYGLGLLAFLPKGQNNLEITYTAGYEVPPTDIAEACANYAATRQMVFWKQAISQGLSGIGLGCVSLNFNSLFSEWLPMVQQSADAICDNYQRVLLDVF